MPIGCVASLFCLQNSVADITLLLMNHFKGVLNFWVLTEDVIVHLGWTYCLTVGTFPEKNADRPPVPAALQASNRTK
jgi:hypothetical protein